MRFLRAANSANSVACAGFSAIGFSMRRCLPLPNKSRANFEMRACRGSDRGRVHLFAKILERSRGANTKVVGNLLRAGAIDVVDRRKFGRGQRSIKTSVILPDVPDSDDANAHFVHSLGAILQEPFVGAGNPFAQSNRWTPAKAAQF